MPHARSAVLFSSIAVTLGTLTHSSAAQLSISRSSLDGGGGFSQGGPYGVAGVVGLPAAGAPSGGAFSVDAGIILPPSPMKPEPCLPDLSPPIGALDFNDVVVFLTAFAQGGPTADFAPPIGVLDFNDVVSFLTLFAAGCP